ncbi:MAG TPA: hypothetical protein VMI53_04525 [Opitutaceae bacterium]|nr:hypothetical protein [Opitutaceae bacterium]
MPSTPIIRCLVLLALAGVVARTGRGATDLTPHSPFMPPGGDGATDANTPPPSSPVELHGIVSTAEGYKFDLYDAANHKDTWVGFNETGKPYVVHSHDIAHNRITVEYQGNEFTLTLPQSKIAPMGAASTMAMPMPMMRPPTVMGAQPGVTPAPNAEDERRRIELITEEIRRRRALRAAQQRQQQFQPQMPTGQPMVPPAH